MWQPGREPISSAKTPWQDALHLPGSGQMQHARALMESRPFLTRIPDQSLIMSDEGTGTDHVQATRDTDGSYAFIYIPSGRPVKIDLSILSGEILTAYWYDPREGTAQYIGGFRKVGGKSYTPLKNGPDWVLVIDDASRSFPVPGAKG